jgi:hypothetical protein
MSAVGTLTRSTSVSSQVFPNKNLMLLENYGTMGLHSVRRLNCTRAMQVHISLLGGILMMRVLVMWMTTCPVRTASSY